MKNKKKLIVPLLLLLSTTCLLGCQSDTPTETQSETKETIIVEEKQTFASVIGIENASVSPYNKLTNFEEFERMLEEKKKQNEVVNNDYEETVYVNNKYYEENDEEPSYVEVEDTTPSPTPEEDTYVSMGVFDITAYTWTGNPMANGEYPYEGCVASCDFAIGTVLYIEGLGTYIVKDVCPTSGVVDIYMNSYNACIQFGRQYRTVYVVK